MPSKILNPPKKKLEDLYLVKKRNMRDIADIYNVDRSVVKRWFTEYAIPIRPPGRGLSHRGISPPTKKELYNLIFVEGLFYHQVAEMYGVDESAIGHWLIKYGLGRTGNKSRGVIDTLTKDDLEELYNNQGHSLDSIGKMYDVSSEVIARLCNEYGIYIHPSGWSAKCFVCNDGHIVKSTYELKVDNWLHDEGIEHIYEPKLPFGRGMYSDFLANGWYIEIWGVVGNRKYEKRKAKKIASYKANRIPLIQIPVHAFDSHRKNQWIRIMKKCLQINLSLPLLQIDL